MFDVIILIIFSFYITIKPLELYVFVILDTFIALISTMQGTQGSPTLGLPVTRLLILVLHVHATVQRGPLPARYPVYTSGGERQMRINVSPKGSYHHLIQKTFIGYGSL